MTGREETMTNPSVRWSRKTPDSRDPRRDASSTAPASSQKHGVEWVGKEGKKDGFVSTLTRMVSVLPEGKPLFRGPCRRVNIEEVDVRRVVTKILRTRKLGRGKSGEVRLGWAKSHIGILENEAADAVAGKSAEGVRTLEDHENWMSGGGMRQWAKQRKRAYLEGNGGKAVTVLAE